MKIQSKQFFLFLMLLISFGSVSAVLFTPALPQISHYFRISENTAQLTVTVFLIGYALGQLLYGPLANRYGYKPAIYIGISGEIIGAVFCILASPLHLFWLLVAARLLMALGASVGLKMTFTLAAAAYHEKKAAVTVSYLMTGFAIMPSLSVALGGFLTLHFGWESCFYLLVFYGLLLMGLNFLAPDLPQKLEPDALRVREILRKYLRKIKNSQLMLGAVLMGVSTAFVYLFAALAPFLTMNYLQLTPAQYGLWNLITPIGLIIGSQMSAVLAKQFAPIKVLSLGILLIFLGVLPLFLLFLFNVMAAWALFFPMIIIYCGIAFIFPNASVIAMQHVTDKPSAAAMMSFINMGVATMAVLTAGALRQTWLLLPSVFLMLSLLACLLIIWLSTLLKAHN